MEAVGPGSVLVVRERHRWLLWVCLVALLVTASAISWYGLLVLAVFNVPVCLYQSYKILTVLFGYFEVTADRVVIVHLFQRREVPRSEIVAVDSVAPWGEGSPFPYLLLTDGSRVAAKNCTSGWNSKRRSQAASELAEVLGIPDLDGRPRTGVPARASVSRRAPRSYDEDTTVGSGGAT